MPDDDFLSFLDAVSNCFLTGDFSLWQERIILPFSLVIPTGPVVMRNEAELRDSFDLYMKSKEALHLDDIVRRPISLEDCKDGTWIGTYETELLCHGFRATAPYTSSALLKHEGGVFRMFSVLNARGFYD